MGQTNLISPFFTIWKKKIQYLSDYCSLQVLGYVLTPSPATLFKRIFWLVTILASSVCSVIVLRGALANYTSDAVSYSVETNYLEFNTPFPAITICDCWVESNKKIVEKYFNVTTVSESLVDFAKEVSFWSVKFCKQCLKCELGRTCIEDFSGLVKFIRKKCTELFVGCTWNDKPFPCCEKFLPIDTEFGTCFVFNSRLTGSETLYTVNRKVGLHTLTFETMTKIMIRVHSSDEMLSVASDKVTSRCDILPLVSDLDLTLSVSPDNVTCQEPPINVDCRGSSAEVAVNVNCHRTFNFRVVLL
ncbi:unnamed protein product [Arctia plantaginis]|uniref:Uncharacterized protein n=1 Tax=Arctia plantaginis TaxID=874455 RepID=A0A8S0ZVM4_ARCPL|nr:unnamed protein product [Arctia plantaginis]